jgi:tetratricopeptide (TPR) repeat protein
MFEFLFLLGIALSKAGNYEESEKVLCTFSDSVESSEYYFYRAVNNFQLNKKEEAIVFSLKTIASSPPQRYYDVALLMKLTAEDWEEEGLEDISREMSKIADRLRYNKGGSATQNLQKGVLSRLEQMIKEQEDAIASQSRQEKEEKEKEAEKQRKIIEEIEKSIQLPKEAPPSSEEGTGQVDKRRKSTSIEMWGKLPVKDRAKFIIPLSRVLPTKDKVVIEKYLQELQKRSSK